MLNIERERGQIQITATCQVCGQLIPNPADATMAYKTMNEPRPRLLHQHQCLKTFKAQHPNNWRYIRAGRVFVSLGY